LKLQEALLSPRRTGTPTLKLSQVSFYTKVEPTDVILDEFSNRIRKRDSQVLEGQCYLKTRSDHFKEHWAMISGQDLLCFRQRYDTESRVMHCLTGTYVQTQSPEIDPDTQLPLYPVRIVIPPNKSRILYFSSVEM
jgi:hypothetical protein